MLSQCHSHGSSACGRVGLIGFVHDASISVSSLSFCMVVSSFSSWSEFVYIQTCMGKAFPIKATWAQSIRHSLSSPPLLLTFDFWSGFMKLRTHFALGGACFAYAHESSATPTPAPHGLFESAPRDSPMRQNKRLKERWRIILMICCNKTAITTLN